MKPVDFYRSLAPDKSPLDAAGFNPYYRPLGGLRQGRPRLSGQPFYDLASNDYLGLASDKRIHQAIIQAVREYGSSLCGTPIATGYAEIFARAERRLARFLGLEDAVLFPSCYQANLALFASVARPEDLILVDHYAHASLANGIKAAGGKIKPFLHNDLSHLEKQLASSAGFRQVFVVTESVFSTEGSVAPFHELYSRCAEYEAIAVVDDSHGIGVLGPTGRGILEDQRVCEYEGIYTASLGKALGQIGGVIAGKRELIEALRYSCPGLIYSTALTPLSVAGLLKALEILEGEFPGLEAKLRANHQRLVSALQTAGFEVGTARAPIASIRRGSTEATLQTAGAFFENRILTTPFVPPSVPPGQGVLRLILGAKLDEPGVQEVLEIIGRMTVEATA